VDQLAEHSGRTSVTLHSSPVNQLAEHSWSYIDYSQLIIHGSVGRAQWSHLYYSPLITRGSDREQLVTLLLLSTHHPWVSWQSTAGHTSVTLHSSPVSQLAEHNWSHFDYSPLVTRGSVGRAQLLRLLLLSTHHQWVSWQRTAGHISATLLSSPVDQLAEYSWSHSCFSPLITRGSAGKAQLVTLLLLSTHHPWISCQSTAGHTSVALHLSPMDQVEEHSWSHLCYSPLINRVSAGRAHWSHFGYSPLNTRVSAGRVQLVTLLLLSTHHPWISWQSTAGQTSVTLHSSSVGQLAEHSWSHFCYSPLITHRSSGRVQLVTLLLLSTHHPWISWQSTAGHTSVTLHSSPVGQLAEHSWSHICYSPLIAHGSAGRAHWSHFCYSPLITRGSAGRAQLVTILLLSTHHPWIIWQSTTGHTSVTLHSSPMDQLAEHSWSHFCYSPLITRGSAGRVQLITLLFLSTHHLWISWHSTASHTSFILHSSPLGQLAEHSWSHFCYSPFITRISSGRILMVTLRLLSTHHPCISWQSTAGLTSVSLHS